MTLLLIHPTYTGMHIHMLLLLICFSRVRLCATPQTAAHQAPLSLGFSSKNIGVGCHFLLQCMKVKSESEVAQSCLTLSDSMDCSPAGSSVHGIFQATVLEWVAISFSDTYAAAAKSLQSYPTLCDPIDSSPPGFPIPGILQARTLVWVAFPSPMHESEK